MRIRSLLLVASLAIAGIPILATPASAACPRFGPDRVAGTVHIAGINEISGVIAGRRWDVLWAEEDSGNPERVYAVSPSGRTRANILVKRSTNRDWEDIAYGGGKIWLGDIGSRRSVVQVYWFPEPKLSARAVIAKHADLRYEGGATHNAEAMFIVGTNLYVVTKERLEDLPQRLPVLRQPPQGRELLLERLQFLLLLGREVLPVGQPQPSAALELGGLFFRQDAGGYRFLDQLFTVDAASVILDIDEDLVARLPSGNGKQADLALAGLQTVSRLFDAVIHRVPDDVRQRIADHFDHLAIELDIAALDVDEDLLAKLGRQVPHHSGQAHEQVFDPLHPRAGDCVAHLGNDRRQTLESAVDRNVAGRFAKAAGKLVPS
jgi:hypothetical protein